MTRLILLGMFVASLATAQTVKKSETITVNGHKVYYEVYGSGNPLLMLHGYSLSTKSLLPIVGDYTGQYEVYLVDLQGHGKSGPYTQNLSIRSAAEDIDGLIKHLKLPPVDAIGFSMGGDVLFQLELIHPGVVRSLTTIGACGTWQSKNFPDWMALFNYANVANLPWMKDHQTSEEQIRIMLDQFPNYDVVLTDDDVKKIGSKTLIIIGDRDTSIPLACVDQLRKNLPESYLWILPNTGHGAHEGKNKNEFVKLSKDFMKNDWKKK